MEFSWYQLCHHWCHQWQISITVFPKRLKVTSTKIADVGIFYACHYYFTSAKLKKFCKRCFCAMKFSYVGHSDFTSDKAVVAVSFLEDWYHLTIFSGWCHWQFCALPPVHWTSNCNAQDGSPRMLHILEPASGGYIYKDHINGLVQDCSISSALIMEILLFCTKPLGARLQYLQCISNGNTRV